MTTQGNQISVDEETRKGVLNKRLEDFGWGVLLVTIGTIWLVPEKQVPQGSWLIAAGLILLGLNATRYFNRIRMSGFSLVAGMLALIAGLSAFFGLKLPLFPIALIVIGVASLLKSLLDRNSMATTGSGWCCCGPREDVSRRDREQGQTVGR
ncbi:MAG: hypothetical protein LAO24_06600 [Acidobacteriia bacterium]|nr:hypothetical protein [Terriglobia bacterium]